MCMCVHMCMCGVHCTELGISYVGVCCSEDLGYRVSAVCACVHCICVPMYMCVCMCSCVHVYMCTCAHVWVYEHRIRYTGAQRRRNGSGALPGCSSVCCAETGAAGRQQGEWA